MMNNGANMKLDRQLFTSSSSSPSTNSSSGPMSSSSPNHLLHHQQQQQQAALQRQQQMYATGSPFQQMGPFMGQMAQMPPHHQRSPMIPPANMMNGPFGPSHMMLMMNPMYANHFMTTAALLGQNPYMMTPTPMMIVPPPYSQTTTTTAAATQSATMGVPPGMIPPQVTAQIQKIQQQQQQQEFTYNQQQHTQMIQSMIQTTKIETRLSQQNFIDSRPIGADGGQRQRMTQSPNSMMTAMMLTNGSNGHVNNESLLSSLPRSSASSPQKDGADLIQSLFASMSNQDKMSNFTNLQLLLHQQQQQDNEDEAADAADVEHQKRPKADSIVSSILENMRIQAEADSRKKTADDAAEFDNDEDASQDSADQVLDYTYEKVVESSSSPTVIETPLIVLSDNFDVSKLQIGQDIMDDLSSRFVLNMPDEEKNDPIRICFQIEIAFWYYVDFYCEAYPQLPRLKLKKFAYVMFKYIPRLRKYLNMFDEVVNTWLLYKFSIPTSGAILLDKSLEYVLLVQGFGSKNWSFPKGKVNHDETLMNCAIREVLEETGYDCTDKINDNVYLERKIFESACRLFMVTDVEMDFVFRPHVRNEIRAIQWFSVNDLPMRMSKKWQNGNGNNGVQQQPNVYMATKFFSVSPFLHSIKKWIERERKRRRKESRESRKANRKRTVSSATGGGNSSDAELGGFTSNGESSSVPSSPFTVQVEPLPPSSSNESTSFVDVQLDEILNNVEHLSKPTVRGFNVFNADSGDQPEVDPRAESEHLRKHCHVMTSTPLKTPKTAPTHANGESNWPEIWQNLVNQYNQRNRAVHTPVGYDLKAKNGGGGGTNGAHVNGIFEDVEEDVDDASSVATTADQSSVLISGLADKSLTCDDKLNYLFQFASNQGKAWSVGSSTPPPTPTTKQSGQIPSYSSTTNTLTSNSSSSSSTANVASKRSPYGAIGSRNKGVVTMSTGTSPAEIQPRFPHPPANGFPFFSIDNVQQQQQAVGPETSLFTKTAATSTAPTNNKSFNALATPPTVDSMSAQLNALLKLTPSKPIEQARSVPERIAQDDPAIVMLQAPSPLPKANGVVVKFEDDDVDQTDVDEKKKNRYNGLDEALVPAVEDKILKLLERLKCGF